MSEKSSLGPDPIHAISFSTLLTIMLRALYNAVKDLIRFCVRHWILIPVFVIAGIAAGVLSFKTSARYYRVSAIVHSTGLSLQGYGQMLNNLNMLAESGSTELLSASLHVHPVLAGKLRTISGANLSGSDLRKDTSSIINNSFILQMTVLDNLAADSLEAAILNYFSTNDYLHKLKADEEHIYTEKLEFLNRELGKMDSLTDAYNKNLAVVKNSPTFYNNAMDPAQIYKQSAKYAEEKVRVEKWLLQDKQPLVRIDGVKPTVSPASTNLFQYLILYTVISFFIGCLIGAIIDISKK